MRDREVLTQAEGQQGRRLLLQKGRILWSMYRIKLISRLPEKEKEPG